MSGWDSPPPGVIQVRQLLERACERLDDGSPRMLVRVNVLYALELTKNLIDDHPQLTMGADGKRWKDE